MMFYAKIRMPDGEERGRMYYGSAGSAQYFADTFSPDAETLELIPFRVTGKTFSERRESLRDTAIRLQAAAAPGLTWGELADIADWLQAQGKQYGLLREFRENGIC